jgi:TonB family protein
VARVLSSLRDFLVADGEGEKAKGEVGYMSAIPYHAEFRTGVMSADKAYTLWPRKVSGPEPQLPAELAGKAGSVYLTVVIGTDGKVQDVKVIGGDSQFVDPVVDAVKQFVYEPQLVGGKPTVATIEASYHFGPRQ